MVDAPRAGDHYGGGDPDEGEREMRQVGLEGRLASIIRECFREDCGCEKGKVQTLLQCSTFPVIGEQNLNSNTLNPNHVYIHISVVSVDSLDTGLTTSNNEDNRLARSVLDYINRVIVK